MPRASIPFLAALLVCAAFPLSGAAPFLSDGETEPVSSWGGYDGTRSCGSTDPVLSIVEVPTLTTLRHVAAGDRTAYTLHVEPSAARPECPTFDLEFTSEVAWPQGSGRVASDCGVTGFLALWNQEERADMGLLVDIPAACGLPVSGSYFFFGTMGRLHAEDGVACPPYSPLGSLCLGVEEGEQDPWCGEGSYTSVWPVFYAGDTCRWDRPDERVAEAYLLVASAGIRTTDESCEIYVQDFFGVVDQTHACPEEVREPVHGLPWGHVLP